MANQPQTMADSQKAVLTPVLTAAGDQELLWTAAQADYTATATWDSAGAIAIGTFSATTEGIGTFTPTATGTGTLKCTVSYVEPDTGDTKTLEQILEVTVVTSFTPTGMTLEAVVVPQ